MLQKYLEDQNKRTFAAVSLAVLGIILFITLAITIPSAIKGKLGYGRSNASGPTITVDPSVIQGTIQTQFSSNDAWAGILAQTPGGQADLNGMQAPYLRLHVGDDGGAAAEPQPEDTYGKWSFANLDVLVNEVFATGQQPLLNMRFAPDWQWSCYPHTQKGQTGSVTDTTFQQYAQYMARVLSYYNKGSMTTESGTVITNPAGTTHKITYWEPWNEPDLNNETPCAPSTGNGLTPTQYLTMWNAVTQAMLAVDPTVKFVGPATAGSQFGSSTSTGNQYVDLIMTNGVIKPSAISFHDYGYWDNTIVDKWIFDGDNSDPTNNCCGGITDMTNGVKAIHSKYPTVPIWLTEVNVNADWGNDTYKRPWSEFAAAWWGAAFQQLAPLNVGIIHEYDLSDAPQFGLIDNNTGNPYMTYYVVKLLDQAFPQGATLISSTSNQSGILSLAAKKPDGTYSVLVVNRQLVSSTVKSSCGVGGVAANVTVTFANGTVSFASRQQLDRTNVNCTSNFAIAPTTVSLDPTQPLTASFPGYGLALFTIGTNGQVIPTVTPTPTPLAGSTPTPTSAPSTFSLKGIVFVDTNGNGTKDTGEVGYALGTPVSISGSATQTVNTTSSGNYTFTGLSNGTYTITLTVPQGYKATNANPKSKTISGANILANFGIEPITTVVTPTPTPGGSGVTPTLTGTTSSSGSTLNIYTNGVLSPFIDNTFSYSAKNACDTSTFVSSPCSYAVTYQSYGAIELVDKTPLLATSYKSLDYNINTNGQAIGNFGITLSTSSGGYINEIRLSSSNITQTLANGWVHISVPMSQLDPKGTSFGTIDLENALSKAVIQIHVDDVQLIGN